MPSQPTIDLSTLPAPTVLLETSFDSIFAAMLADLVSRDPAFTALIESDPAYKILEVAAYREMLKTQQFNQKVVAAMLAYAIGTDLDNLGVTYGNDVFRLGTPATLAVGTGNAGIILTSVITAVLTAASGNGVSFSVVSPGTPSAALTVAVAGSQITVSLATNGSSVPTSTAVQVASAINAYPAAAALVTATLAGTGATVMASAALAFLTGGVNELDDAYRARIQLAPNSYSSAGPKGAYEFFALSVPGVADVSVQGPNDDGAISPGTVVVCVLGSTGTGALADPNPATAGESGEAPLLATVRTALNRDTVRPLNDTVVVRAATIVNYAITATLKTYAGPDPSTVIAAAQAAAAAYAASKHKIGVSITLAGIIAALYQPGVQNVALSLPTADVAITAYQFSNCTAITLTNGGIGA